MKQLKLISFLLLLGLILLSTISCANQDKYEITQMDITQLPSLRSDHISLFGVSLGMSLKDAEKILKSSTSLIVTRERSHIAIYDINSDGTKNTCIASYGLDANQKILSFAIYDTCIQYLIGRSKALLTPDVANPNSYIRKSFLGKPDKIDVLGNEQYFFYPKNGVYIVCNISIITTIYIAFEQIDQ